MNTWQPCWIRFPLRVCALLWASAEYPVPQWDAKYPVPLWDAKYPAPQWDRLQEGQDFMRDPGVVLEPNNERE